MNWNEVYFTISDDRIFERTVRCKKSWTKPTQVETPVQDSRWLPCGLSGTALRCTEFLKVEHVKTHICAFFFKQVIFYEFVIFYKFFCNVLHVFMAFKSTSSAQNFQSKNLTAQKNLLLGLALHCTALHFTALHCTAAGCLAYTNYLCLFNFWKGRIY